MNMLILDSPSEDPRFNIAAEEYLLKETDHDYAFFYIDGPSIIIGKHQNAWAEINLPWTRRNNIPVIRRISGGGTVWHDRGNLNFSFILNGEKGKLVNFRQYATPILEFLKELGIPAAFGERNEILAGGMKISGNAEHVHRQRVLHHGTLLFSSDLEGLRQALDASPDLYQDKAVQSVRSRTANIRDFLDREMDISAFRRQLLGFIQRAFPGSERVEFRQAEIHWIETLAREKYSLWKWNIGYSPRYRLEREFILGQLKLRAELEVEKGRIKTISLSPAGQGSGDLDDILQTPAGSLENLAGLLAGKDHDPDSLRAIIAADNLVKPQWIDNFVEGLF